MSVNVPKIHNTRGQQFSGMTGIRTTDLGLPAYCRGKSTRESREVSLRLKFGYTFDPVMIQMKLDTVVC